MKVYADTWIYVTEKFGNMGYIEVYEGILRYETGIYPTIPSFIYAKLLLLYFAVFQLSIVPSRGKKRKWGKGKGNSTKNTACPCGGQPCKTIHGDCDDPIGIV